MAIEPTTSRVTATTELPDLLDEATNQPIILERNGVRYRLSREDDIAYEPNADLVGATLEATAGSWADLDIDRLIDDIHAARRPGRDRQDHHRERSEGPHRS